MSVASPWVHRGAFLCLNTRIRLNMTAPMHAEGVAPASLDAAAFQRLYPEQYLQRFVDDGLRPDGRTLGRSRATTVGLGAISSADGSALVRVGHTTVLAGARVGIAAPEDSSAQQGKISINVELAPFAQADSRSSRATETTSMVAERVEKFLQQLHLTPQLFVQTSEGAAVYIVDLDVYVLNADGAVLDAVLLAAVAALRDLKLPPISINSGSRPRLQSAHEASSAGASPGRLTVEPMPLCLTTAIFHEHLLADPTAEEEAVAHAAVSVVVDDAGQLHGVFKSGGMVLVTPKVLTRCIEGAKLHYKQVAALMEQALQHTDS